MRIVGRPHQVLETEVVPHLKSRAIVHERQEDLPVEVEARELLNGGILVAELDLLIEHGEVPVYPSEAGFDEQDPQLGEPGEGSREDPERQVLGQSERRQGREDALARRGVASKDVPERLLDAEMLADREARLRQRAPERVAARVV